MNDTIIGLDIAKQSFHLVKMDFRGKITQKKRLYRSDVLSFFSNCESSLVVMESCAGSHYWSRELKKLGHDCKLISPHLVKPYLKANKNDLNDAEAIAEAGSRKNMRFVSPKSIAQQDIQALHRVRERRVKERTALVNQIRGVLGEYGVVIAQGRAQFEETFWEKVTGAAEENKLSSLTINLLEELFTEYLDKNRLVLECEKRLKRISKSHPECKRLEDIPGVGYLTSTAILGVVGSIEVFKNSRQFAAYLGLVPRQHSTGGKPRLLGISKRGNPYLRKLLIHGARASLRWSKQAKGRRGVWLRALEERRGHNITAVALANKNARTIWSLLKRGESYRSSESFYSSEVV